MASKGQFVALKRDYPGGKYIKQTSPRHACWSKAMKPTYIVPVIVFS